MHYYRFNIGDYRRKTGHLSLLEHGIYRVLIDTYYLGESPLVADDANLMRLHSIRTEDEKQAFKNVLEDFFICKDGHYFHHVCDDEIQKYHEKSQKARESAEARWGKPEEKQDDKAQDANAIRTDSEGNANDMRTPCETDANHLTNNHKPITNKEKNEIIFSVVDYLNKKLGTKFRPSTAKTKTSINARIIEGYSIGDFKTVIDKKHSQWIKTDQSIYLRPETLFGNKFEGYLNEVSTVSEKPAKLEFEKYKQAFEYAKEKLVNGETKKFKDDGLNKIIIKYPYILDYELDSQKFELTYKEYLKL